MTKPFAESCEQNKQPILQVLLKELSSARHLLEIGSGTGQHAVFFASHLPDLTWQPSDLGSTHDGINAWIAEADVDNVLPPLELDVTDASHWPRQHYDAVFSANAVHIMGWQAVVSLFNGLGQILSAQAKLCLYGPFNYQGQYTSESNARFDQWLKQRDPQSGIRNFEDLNSLANQQGLVLHRDYEMPANNRMLIWRKE